MRTLLTLMVMMVAGPVSAQTWAVDPAASGLGFQATVEGEAVNGQFKSWQAQITFDPDAPKSCQIVVTIDMASVDTRNSTRDAMLPGNDWFHIKAHPQAAFVAKRCEKTGAGRYVAKGALSLRGVTRPVDLPFQLEIDGDLAHMSGQVVLDRREFGVGQGEWQSTDTVAASVRITPTVTARRIKF